MMKNKNFQYNGNIKFLESYELFIEMQKTLKISKSKNNKKKNIKMIKLKQRTFKRINKSKKLTNGFEWFGIT